MFDTEMSTTNVLEVRSKSTNTKQSQGLEHVSWCNSVENFLLC